ncbi:MAG: hypothetical protein EOM31_03820 [Bacteroidia bacterium]|nr:hypothetical protein [Bacteroidia bacterium]
MKAYLILISIFLVLVIGVHAHSLDKEKTVKNERKENPTLKEMNWEFYSTIKNPTQEALTAENDYKFGGMAGYLYRTFTNLYVFREEVIPGDPRQRQIIRKPIIYKAVCQIEKQLYKDVKKEQLNSVEAAKKFEEILKKAISAFDSDTNSFEKALSNCPKEVQSIYEIFDRVKLIEL